MICKTQTLKGRTNVLEKMIKIAKVVLNILNIFYARIYYSN